MSIPSLEITPSLRWNITHACGLVFHQLMVKLGISVLSIIVHTRGDHLCNISCPAPHWCCISFPLKNSNSQTLSDFDSNYSLLQALSFFIFIGDFWLKRACNLSNIQTLFIALFTVCRQADDNSSPSIIFLRFSSFEKCDISQIDTFTPAHWSQVIKIRSWLTILSPFRQTLG